MPVINENDTTTTDEISFGDNDFLAAQLAILLGAERLLLLTDIDGLFTPTRASTPRRATSRGARLRAARAAPDRRVDLAARVGRDALEGGGRRDGDGGRHPRDDPERHAAGGDRCGPSRASPRAPRFQVQRQRVSSFKLWLKYAKPSHGRVVVDAGAERALRERGT